MLKQDESQKLKLCFLLTFWFLTQLDIKAVLLGDIVTILHLSFISHTNIKTLVTQQAPIQQHNNTKSSDEDPDIL